LTQYQKLPNCHQGEGTAAEQDKGTSVATESFWHSNTESADDASAPFAAELLESFRLFGPQKSDASATVTAFSGKERLTPVSFQLAQNIEQRQPETAKPGDILLAQQVQTVPNLATDRTAFEAQARTSITKNRDIKRLLDDMTTFETRAKSAGITDAQVDEVYKHATRLLAEPQGTMSQSDRNKIALQIIRNSAKPNNIDQGHHGTCNVSVVEGRIYTRNPEAAAKLIADVATTGSFTTADGAKITPTARSLQADDEAGGTWASDGERGLAGQVFQVTAANIKWQRQVVTPDFRLSKLGQIVYEQIPNKRSRFSGDTGERVMDYNVTPPRETTKYSQGPSLSVSDLTDISNQITGKTEKDFVFENKVHAGRDTITVSSPQELETAILDAQKNGKLPAFIRVHTGNDPFLTDQGGWFSRQRGVWHVVSVTNYDQKSKKVSIDNQWGGSSDRAVDLEKLYKATMEPGTDEWKKKHEFFIVPGLGKRDPFRSMDMSPRSF
jgi:hypothetical protein